MDDVERLFRQLVTILADTDPASLTKPVQISEIYKSILPYRRYRAALGFDTSLDYDMALLRLLAGEGGFVRVAPDVIQDALATEARAVNPNPGAFREYAAAEVYLDAGAVTTVTEALEVYGAPPRDQDDHARYAPPTLREEPARRKPMPPPLTPGARESPGAPEQPPWASDTETPSCTACHRPLPPDRFVRFCPFCGQSTETMRCPACRAVLEFHWEFCISCGQRVTDA
jgi:hypothetical protein